MSWLRTGDTAADFPAVNAVAALDGAPDGAALLMHGFMFCLATSSAAWKTDYVVDVGTIMKHGGMHGQWLLKAAVKTGLLSKVKGKVHGVDAYKIIDNNAYIHIKLKAESDWEAQQRAETDDTRVSVPVRLRDGDLCRYCGVCTYWVGGNQSSNKRGTLDHLVPADAEGNHPPATIDTLVVACLKCNATIGDTAPDNRPGLRPPPETPFYGKTTAAFLSRYGYPTSPTNSSEQRPATAEPAFTGRQRPATAEPARPADSDPAPAGHRAAQQTRPQAGAPPPTEPLPLTGQITDGSGNLNCSGSGRDGSGSAPLSVPNPATTQRRRKRSARGNHRPAAPHEGDR